MTGSRRGERRILRVDRVVSAAEDCSPGFVSVLDGLVEWVGPVLPPGLDASVDSSSISTPPPERLSGTLVPGFVDQHVHGALGVDFGSATVSEALRVVDFHAARGSTSLVASIATAPVAALVDSLATLAPLVEHGDLAGIHLEGPFLAESRRGAHDAALLRPPTIADLSRLVDAASGALRLVTLAPELPGALEAVTWLVEHGIAVALGHSDCDRATAGEAFDRGASVATHLFNGMRPLHHREPGLVGAALDDERVLVELIVDGHHLAAPIVSLVRRLAPGRLALISDAMSATGLGDGDYAIAGSAVAVHGGVATLADGSSLAGSTTTVGEALVRSARSGASGASGVSFAEAVAMTSASSARALGLVGRGLRPGDRADLVVLDDSMAVTGVMRHGEWLPPVPPPSPSPSPSIH